ncbi:MAG: D-TA family PLP-dependent enzyme [Bacteroidales bacterium]|nr:D-TA family PLP-dependent enzyme [Bacteroidales bacterium]
MPHAYHLSNAAELFTPSLVFFPELIRKNIARTVEMAGSASRLRPHAKTHKTREITRMQLEAGVTKHKCATIAEAEILADSGVPDVLLAYALVGPNGKRFGALAKKFPNTRFAALFDCSISLNTLAVAAQEAGRPLGAMIDLNVGMDRSGIVIGDDALALYEQAAKTPGLYADGLHAYDGHTRHSDPAERLAFVRGILDSVLAFQKRIEQRGLSVPKIVAGGTPSFPCYASIRDVPHLECSPGTYVLHDHGYGANFPDYAMIPAAVLLTRVISRPTPTRVTFDLGNKSVAPDPILTKRVYLLDAPEHTVVTHSEEHLVIETAEADRYQPGDLVYALPGHICPSVALHQEVFIAEGGRVVGRWEVAARNRFITV